MRMLNTRTGQFISVDDPRKVRYAILSHVWARKGDPSFTPFVPEQMYQDVCRLQDDAGGNSILPQLSEKIRRFCEAALRDGFELGWADSCCIDKSSSAELSEAINSMYNWYSCAGVCYAFLHDVRNKRQFGKSRWFKRGWTLQELIASTVLVFLSKDWEILGSKHVLASLVEDATGIESAVLTFERPLDEVSVARRMSWAATRETTREEDRAYSLMGIFGVNMPITYGEGSYAFVRLQEEILKQIPDQSIFAWGWTFSSEYPFKFSPPSTLKSSSVPIAASSPKQYMLASSPKDFHCSLDLTNLSREEFATKLGIGIDSEDAYQLFPTTAHGIHTRLPLVATALPSQDPRTTHPTLLALLACEDTRGWLLALILRPHRPQNSRTQYFVGDSVSEPSDSNELSSHYARGVFLSPEQVRSIRARDVVERKNVYISHRATRTQKNLEHDAAIHFTLRERREDFEVHLSGWSRNLLRMQGYEVAPGDGADVALPTRILSRTLSSSMSGFTISGPEGEFNIQVGPCNCDFPDMLGVLVSSSDAVSSFENCFARDHHSAKHPVHVNSWSFHRGTAMKEMEVSGPTGKRLALRLTLTYGAPDIEHSRKASYQLGVEVCSRLPERTSTCLPPNTRLSLLPPSRGQSTPGPAAIMVTAPSHLEEFPQPNMINYGSGLHTPPRSDQSGGSGGSLRAEDGSGQHSSCSTHAPPGRSTSSSRHGHDAYSMYEHTPSVSTEGLNSQDVRDRSPASAGSIRYHSPSRRREPEQESYDAGIYRPARIRVSADASDMSPSSRKRYDSCSNAPVYIFDRSPPRPAQAMLPAQSSVDPQTLRGPQRTSQLAISSADTAPPLTFTADTRPSGRPVRGIREMSAYPAAPSTTRPAAKSGTRPSTQDVSRGRPTEPSYGLFGTGHRRCASPSPSRLPLYAEHVDHHQNSERRGALLSHSSRAL